MWTTSCIDGTGLFLTSRTVPVVFLPNLSTVQTGVPTVTFFTLSGPLRVLMIVSPDRQIGHDLPLLVKVLWNTAIWLGKFMLSSIMKTPSTTFRPICLIVNVPTLSPIVATNIVTVGTVGTVGNASMIACETGSQTLTDQFWVVEGSFANGTVSTMKKIVAP